MTAINIVTTPTLITIATDGAIYDDELRVTGIGSKIDLIPNLSGAFAFRGMNISNELRWCFSGYISFDQLLTNLDTNFRDITDGLESPIELIVTGFSKEGPTTRFICNDQSETASVVQPYKSMQCGSVACGPSLGDEFSLPLNADMPRDLVVKRLRQLVAAQRRQITDNQGRHAVGGFCQITTIAPKSIETRITDRWPDQIGEFIQPEKDA